MEFTYKKLTPLEVMARIVENGGPVDLYVYHCEDALEAPYLYEVTGADVDPGNLYPIITIVDSYRFAAERVLEFGDCPSPHGWHNPENMTPWMVYSCARRNWGEDVDPSTVRLLTRDEIGRRDPYHRIVGNGVLGRAGYSLNYTYFTTAPYGELPAVEEYTFPESAPYGWSGKTGQRIEIPEGWELVPEEELPDVYEEGEYRVYWSDLGYMPLAAMMPGAFSTIRLNVKDRTIYAVIRRKPPTWRNGDLVEVIEDERGMSGVLYLKAGARGVVTDANWGTGRLRIRQTSPDPVGSGHWNTSASNLRPWTPGYGYTKDGNRVPEPPETHELVEERAEIGEDAMYYSVFGSRWIHTANDPDSNAQVWDEVRAYARRKKPLLQLREGGLYKTRSGALVGPLGRNTFFATGEAYPWRIKGKHTYTDAGRAFAWHEHKDDLVMELVGVIGFVS